MGKLIFTDEEDLLIKELYPKCKKEELTKLLGKSWQQIICRARYFKVRYGGKCVLCGDRATKYIDDYFVCRECYYSKGGKCQDCGKVISFRSNKCIKCARKHNNNHALRRHCLECGKNIYDLSKFGVCRVCYRRLRIDKHVNKIACKCLECGKEFFVSKYSYHNGRGKYCSVRCIGVFKGKNLHFFARHSFPFLRKDGKTINMRSSWEVRVAKSLEDDGIKFEYELYPIWTPFGYYYPDFYIPENNMYIEVKGFMTEKAKNKIDYAREQGNHILLFDTIVMKQFFPELFIK